MAKVSGITPILRAKVIAKIQGGEKRDFRTINLISFLALSAKCRIIKVITQEKCPLLHGACSSHPSFPSSHLPLLFLVTQNKIVCYSVKSRTLLQTKLFPKHGLKKWIRVCVHKYWVLENIVCSNKKSTQEIKMPQVLFVLIMTSEPFIVFQLDTTNLKLCSFWWLFHYGY